MVPGEHAVGEDMAITPGKVVFRNDLMELIQYAPSTSQVHEIPLLFSPPWINKYYIMDLAPGRSLVQWAVDHGHTAFMISYRNPDEQMRHVKMDDYLISGPIAALEVVGTSPVLRRPTFSGSVSAARSRWRLWPTSTQWVWT